MLKIKKGKIYLCILDVNENNDVIFRHGDVLYCEEDNKLYSSIKEETYEIKDDEKLSFMEISKSGKLFSIYLYAKGKKSIEYLERCGAKNLKNYPEDEKSLYYIGFFDDIIELASNSAVIKYVKEKGMELKQNE